MSTVLELYADGVLKSTEADSDTNMGFTLHELRMLIWYGNYKEFTIKVKEKNESRL